jgi:energy-coupling factor transporter ATP-binding protein EcfA2
VKPKTDAARRDLERRASKLVRALELPEPRFRYTVAWAYSYRSLFSQEHLDATPPDAILEAASKSGRVLLCGRAGSGKSVILKQLAKLASDQGALVVWIDLRRWISADSVPFEQEVGDSSACMNFMVRSFSGLNANLLDLDMVPPGKRKVIFIDGLNEVPSAIGAVVLRAADDVVKRLLSASVIVADRLSRRPISEERWRLARVEPLSRSSIELVYKEARPGNPPPSASLLDWPFFLARAIAGGQDRGTNGADSLRLFFTESVHLSATELRTVASAAYDIYLRTSSRSFELAKFRDHIGDVAADKLIHAGALDASGSVAHFKHHLHHDFLAANHVARDESLWGYAGFDALSFKGSAFDAIAIAFALVEKPLKSTFVRRVYDWNPYAISVALAESEYREPQDIDWDLESVVLSMLAEKRWDPIIPTAEKASDALSLFPRDKVSGFLFASSLHELLSFVLTVPSQSRWFMEWKSYFCIESSDAVLPEAFERLRDHDSIIGWTLANVLKRFRLTEEQVALVILATESPRAEVRWRAVHVLGASVSDETASIVFKRLDEDEDSWVQYGAVRSLVEMAAFDAFAVRKKVFEGMVARRERISSNRRLRDEFVSATRISLDRTAEGWSTTALSLLSTYLDSSDSLEDIDYWARAMYRFRLDQSTERRQTTRSTPRSDEPREGYV